MFMCNFSQIIVFVALQLSGKKNSFALRVFLSPNLRKDTCTYKGLNNLPPTQRLTTDLRNIILKI